MHPKDKIPSQLKQHIIYKWSCSDENCNISCIGESSRCLENRIKGHNNHVTSAIYQHNVSSNHPIVNNSYFKIIDQDSKQVAREAREAIHIRINNPVLKWNSRKMCIQEIFNSLFGADGSTNESSQMVDSVCPQHLTVPSHRFSRAVCLAN